MQPPTLEIVGCLKKFGAGEDVPKAEFEFKVGLMANWAHAKLAMNKIERVNKRSLNFFTELLIGKKAYEYKSFSC